MCVCVCVCVSIHLSHPSIHPSFHYPSFHPSIHPSIYLIQPLIYFICKGIPFFFFSFFYWNNCDNFLLHHSLHSVWQPYEFLICYFLSNVSYKHYCVIPNNIHASVSLNIHSFIRGVRCSSIVRAFPHGAMNRQIDPSWWTHLAISHSSQCSTTGVTKAVVCYPVCGMMHIKEPLLLIRKSSPCGGSGFPLSLFELSFTI